MQSDNKKGSSPIKFKLQYQNSVSWESIQTITYMVTVGFAYEIQSTTCHRQITAGSVCFGDKKMMAGRGGGQQKDKNNLVQFIRFIWDKWLHRKFREVEKTKKLPSPVDCASSYYHRFPSPEPLSVFESSPCWVGAWQFVIPVSFKNVRAIGLFAENSHPQRGGGAWRALHQSSRMSLTKLATSVSLASCRVKNGCFCVERRTNIRNLLQSNIYAFKAQLCW